MNDTKLLVKYENKYCVLIPVFYEYETRPAWRKYFIGTRAECENVFTGAPDQLKATAAENAENRHYKRLEYIYCMNRGDVKKAMNIKEQYKL